MLTKIISFIPDNLHYFLIKIPKKKEKIVEIEKKMLILQRVIKKLLYYTTIIQRSKPSFPSLENGFDGERENIVFPVNFCVSNLVSSNNLLTHTGATGVTSLLNLFSVCVLRRIPLRQRTYMWFLRLNFCILLRRLVI